MNTKTSSALSARDLAPFSEISDSDKIRAVARVVSMTYNKRFVVILKSARISKEGDWVTLRMKARFEFIPRIKHADIEDPDASLFVFGDIPLIGTLAENDVCLQPFLLHVPEKVEWVKQEPGTLVIRYGKNPGKKECTIISSRTIDIETAKRMMKSIRTDEDSHRAA